MVFVRLTLWATAVLIVAASLAILPVCIYVLFTEGGPLGGAILLTAIAVGLAAGGPYVGYLLVRTSRRLARYRPHNLSQELQLTAIWLLAVIIAAFVTPLPGDMPLGARIIIAIVFGMIGVIGVAHALDQERRKSK